VRAKRSGRFDALGSTTLRISGVVMELAASPQDYWTEPRRELQAWFQMHAPSLGELYESALQMLHNRTFPGRVHFISHAVREIRNRLPDVIAGRRGGGRVDYVTELDPIARDWVRYGFLLDGSIPTTVSDSQALSTSVSVPIPLFRKLSSLLKKHVDGREKKYDAAIRLFEAIAPENIGKRDSLRPIILHWLDITDWFEKKTHHPGRNYEMCTHDELQTKFELFETALGALIRGFFETIEDLDEILEDTNS
jgi:hypothetical protein